MVALGRQLYMLAQAVEAYMSNRRQHTIAYSYTPQHANHRLRTSGAVDLRQDTGMLTGIGTGVGVASAGEHVDQTSVLYYIAARHGM